MSERIVDGSFGSPVYDDVEASGNDRNFLFCINHNWLSSGQKEEQTPEANLRSPTDPSNAEQARLSTVGSYSRQRSNGPGDSYDNSPVVGDQFRVGKRIGNGSFSNLYLGVHKPTGVKVAIKMTKFQAPPSNVRHHLYEDDGRESGLCCDGPRNYSEYDETYVPSSGCFPSKSDALTAGIPPEDLAASTTQTGEITLCKSKLLAVSRESYIIKSLQGERGIPEMMWSGRMLWQGSFHEALVMQLLGPSMQDMNELYGKKEDGGAHRISQRSGIVMAVQLLSILEAIHRRGFIHCDIKPENILLGMKGSPNEHVCHLVDFGFSVPFVHQVTNMHRPFRKGLINPGTPRYASLNVHKGYSLSRRDDLESMAYMMVYMLKGTVPWSGLRVTRGENRQTKIMQTKHSTAASKVCKELPREFSIFLSYSKDLAFEQAPDYQYLRDQFSNLFSRMEYEELESFQWEKDAHNEAVERRFLANNSVAVNSVSFTSQVGRALKQSRSTQPSSGGRAPEPPLNRLA